MLIDALFDRLARSLSSRRQKSGPGELSLHPDDTKTGEPHPGL